MVHRQWLFYLLRSHVVWRADDISVAGERRDLSDAAQDFGDSKIGYFCAPAFIEQDILRLDIAMDDAFAMGELKCFTDLRDDRQRLLGGKFPGVFDLPKITAVDVLHQQIVQGWRDLLLRS